jgi:uncharacterized membrane protein HdeD (DUF308 family)
MFALQILVTLSTIVAITAGIPQMLKLIRVRNSDEFNKSTWLLWVATQSVSTVYACALGDILLIAVNTTWVIFYSIMVFLILYYDPKRGPGRVSVEIDNESSKV